MAILVTKSSIPKYEEYIEEIKPIFENYWLTNMGPIHEKLEAKLLEYLDVPSISLFSNGHLALEIAIHALGLRKNGGEVITTPFTFVSTTNAIVRNGLKPVFCDIKEDDYTIDPTKIEDLITDNTVAILPVHVYGNVCDVEAIEQIARKHELKVIYDAAHAFGVKYKRTGIGNFGDASMFSFHATKVFNTIEGGAITFKDASLTKSLRDYKNFGLDEQGDVYSFAGNAKMDEFRAAMGLCNLRHVNESIIYRKKAHERYMERFANTKGIKVNGIKDDVEHNYSYFPVCFDKKMFGKSSNEILLELKSKDIFARRYFYPPINEMRIFRKQYGEADTPVAHNVSSNILCLPMFEGLSICDVDKICDIILK